MAVSHLLRPARLPLLRTSTRLPHKRPRRAARHVAAAAAATTAAASPRLGAARAPRAVQSLTYCLRLLHTAPLAQRSVNLFRFVNLSRPVNPSRSVNLFRPVTLQEEDHQ